MLPPLTPLQYLVVNLLFAGRQSGDDLRRQLRSLGVPQSRAAFSRLISRLVEAMYVDGQRGTRVFGAQTVHIYCYEVTDLGVYDWITTQKFYQNLPPPSHDLVPITTESGQLAAYDAKTRNRESCREFRDQLFSSMSRAFGIDLTKYAKPGRIPQSVIKSRRRRLDVQR